MIFSNIKGKTGWIKLLGPRRTFELHCPIEKLKAFKTDFVPCRTFLSKCKPSASSSRASEKQLGCSDCWRISTMNQEPPRALASWLLPQSDPKTACTCLLREIDFLEFWYSASFSRFRLFAGRLVCRVQMKVSKVSQCLIRGFRSCDLYKKVSLFIPPKN